MPNQSLARTWRRWGQRAAERDPAAHDTCLCIKHTWTFEKVNTANTSLKKRLLKKLRATMLRVLTVQVCTKGRSCGGYTECSGILWRPGLLESLWERDILLLVEWWSLSALRTHTQITPQAFIFKIWALSCDNCCLCRTVKQAQVWKVTLEEVGDVLQLGDVVFSVATVFDQQREVLQILLAGMGDVQFVELPEHNTPGTHLLFCEVYATNRTAADRTQCQCMSTSIICISVKLKGLQNLTLFFLKEKTNFLFL